MQKIYDTLVQLHIPYQEHTHPAIFTSAEAAKYFEHIPGAHVKNLFLRNRNGNQHYLAVVLDHKKVDLKQLAKSLNESQLGFASPERLMKYLNVTPGSVSALGLIFDTAHHVNVLVDQDCAQYGSINLHPNDNTKTLTVGWSDFKKYLDWCGNPTRDIVFDARNQYNGSTRPSQG